MGASRLIAYITRYYRSMTGIVMCEPWQRYHFSWKPIQMHKYRPRSNACYELFISNYPCLWYVSNLDFQEMINYIIIIYNNTIITTHTLITHYLYLFWWGGHCCPMHCDLFQIYCAPPNLGILGCECVD